MKKTDKFLNAWIPLFIFGILAIFLNYRFMSEYFRYSFIDFNSLEHVEGVISQDTRTALPPFSGLRQDGIYIKTNNGYKNIYCDNPKKPLNQYGASNGGGTYDLGACDWITQIKIEKNFCDSNNLISCQNPRNLYGRKLEGKIDENNTIYEIYIDGLYVYKFEEMKSLYKEKAFSHVRFFLFITVIFIVFGILSLFKKYKQIKGVV